MRVAVIGGGIAGLVVAQGLESIADVSLFEAESRLGGHTDTLNLLVEERAYAIDSGFVAFNEQKFPQFTHWLAQLGVATQPATTSFAVDFSSPQLCYGTEHLGALFCHKSNLRTPRFLRMLVDIVRFYREARQLQGQDRPDELPTLTLGDYLAEHRYGRGFVDDHLLPLCSVLWSIPPEHAKDLPLRLALESVDVHKLLQFDRRSSWRSVVGGANTYVAAFVGQFEGALRLATPVVRVERNPGGVRLTTPMGEERFDQVVFACHPDQALAIMDATPLERQLLGAMPVEEQRAVVHSDPSFMPRQRRAWSSWNLVGPTRDDADRTCWMNQLQSIESPQNFFITLNPSRTPEHRWAERSYSRGVLTPAALAAQTRRSEINGMNCSYFAGAYWGLGTHEDGVVSANAIVAALSMKVRAVA